MLQAGPLLRHAAPSLFIFNIHTARAWVSVACSKGAYNSSPPQALQSANRCIFSVPSVHLNQQTASPPNLEAAAPATTQHLQEWNSCSSPSWLHHIGSHTARFLQQQQQQQPQHLWGFRQYSQATTPAAAPAEAQQQQQQQQPAVPSASEAATSSFIKAPSAATAAAGTPAAKAGAASAAAAAAASVGGVLAGGVAGELKEYSVRQVSKHASDETCWIVVNGKVYDVTSYIDDHPGGAESILLNAGVDCTDEFMGVHSQEAKELLEKFIIGTVKPGTKKPLKQPAVVVDLAAAAAAADPSLPLVTLQDPRERYALPLTGKQRLNHDTYFMRFALPSPRHLLGLPCGKHVFLCADIGGEGVVRAYTPISGDRDPGVLEFLIKVYWSDMHPKFPEGGKMTQHLAAMKEGDTIDVKGPYGKFCYEGKGRYTLNRVPGQARYLSMISGGSGITPCYSVLREVLRDPSDTTRCSLIYANKHEEDIWLKQELEAMVRDNPERFHLWYVLEEPGTPPSPIVHGADAAAAAAAAATPTAAAAPWTHSRGYITWDMMAQHLLPPQPVVMPSGSDHQQQQGGSLALMCGPPGMLEHVVVPGLTAMGYTAEQMVVF